MSSLLWMLGKRPAFVCLYVCTLTCHGKRVKYYSDNLLPTHNTPRLVVSSLVEEKCVKGEEEYEMCKIVPRFMDMQQE